MQRAGDLWDGAARAYATMNDRARAAYWTGLTPDQQTLLRVALANTLRSVMQSRGDTSTRNAGCIGVILGSVLTIALELWVITLGVDAFKREFMPPEQQIDCHAIIDDPNRRAVCFATNGDSER